jgi:F0F1-type ATP synthase membrane subunit c/vacuolar-type H+-ATPase subunit K
MNPTLRAMRLIGVALATGVTLFAGVAWLIQPAAPPAPADPTLLYLWIAISTTLAAVAMIVWRGRVAPYLERSEAETDWRPRAERIQGGLILTWALVEAAALMGVVVYFVEGHALAGFGGVVLMWGALAMTWPKEAWLQPDGEAGRATL